MSDGIGFGISAAMVQHTVSALIETGSFEHSYLGARVRQVTPQIADANDLDRAQGIIVVDTLEETPADSALTTSELESIGGDQVPVGGDVILQLDETPIFTQTELSTYLVLQTTPGERLSMDVIRDGTRQVIEATLVARPAPGKPQAPA